MNAAGGNLPDRSAHRDGRDGSGRLVVAETFRRAVAELPLTAVAPALDVTALEEGARVEGAGGDLDDGFTDVDGLYGARRLVVADVFDGSVAELPVVPVGPSTGRFPSREGRRYDRHRRRFVGPCRPPNGRGLLRRGLHCLR